MKTIIFIGDRFYSESSSVMSSLYEEGTWNRYDWGFVQCDLRDGIALTIRPATAHEMDVAERKLLKWKTEYNDAEAVNGHADRND